MAWWDDDTDYSQFGSNSSNMGAEQYEDQGFDPFSWLKKTFYDPIPFLHEAGQDVNRKLGYIDPNEWHMPEDEREIGTLERIGLAAVPKTETTSLGVLNPLLPGAKMPFDFFENLGKEDWELKKQAGETIQQGFDVLSPGDVATLGLGATAKGVSRIPKAGETLIKAAKAADILSGATALGVGGAETFEGFRDMNPERILGGAMTGGMGLLGLHEYLPTGKVNPVEAKGPVDRSVGTDEPNWQDMEIDSILGEQAPESFAQASRVSGPTDEQWSRFNIEEMVNDPAYIRAENIAKEAIRRASDPASKAILDNETPSKFRGTIVDPTLYGQRFADSGGIELNILEHAARSKTPEEFAAKLEDTIAHELGHQGTFHEEPTVDIEGKPYSVDASGNVAELPESVQPVNAYQERGKYLPDEQAFVNRQDLIKHNPEIAGILQTVRQALSDPEIFTRLKSLTPGYRQELSKLGYEDTGIASKVEGEDPNRTAVDLDEWKRQQVEDYNFTPEEVETAITEARSRGVDPTMSDTLYSLGDHLDALDDPNGIDRPPTSPQEPLIPKVPVTESQVPPVTVQESVPGVQESVQAEIPARPEPTIEKQEIPKTFNEFLNNKFGTKATTAKERGFAKAEWQRLKEKQKIIDAAKAAGLPPEKIDQLTAKIDEAPKPEEAKSLSLWHRTVSPVIENLQRVHPELGEKFRRFVTDSEAPAMKQVAETHKMRQALSKDQSREVVDILDGSKDIANASPEAKTVAEKYRALLDQVWEDAKKAGVISAERAKREKYFPHKFKEGWESDILKTPHIDKAWEVKSQHLEKARLSRRADYRRDLDVVDEYIIGSYRRISEVQHFGKRLTELRKFLASAQVNEPTANWLRTNLRRVLGREEVTTFSKVSGHARHLQALHDLGLAALYQPMQTFNTAIHGGVVRSVRGMVQMVKNYPDEMYQAIKSEALTPSIIQEMIQGGYGAQEGIKNRALQKFMWGIPTIDKWTRVHSSVVGRLMVEDALKGNKGAIKDLAAMGFTGEIKPEISEAVSKVLSNKANFRTGNLEVPGWSSSPGGKIATQYTRFMYAHTRFVKDIFKQAAEGNARPAARFLMMLPTIIPVAGEVLSDIRAGLRSVITDTATGQLDEDSKERAEKAIAGKSEVEWMDILRNKRISWSHPLKRALQNIAMWGGLGILQVIVERASQPGTNLEKGSRYILGPVGTNASKGLGAASKDATEGTVDETEKWAVEQVPMIGYDLRKELFPKKKKRLSLESDLNY